MNTFQVQYKNLKRRNNSIIILLFLSIPLFFILDVFTGTVYIPFSDIISILSGSTIENQAYQIIIADTRFPQAIFALATGMGLSVCGLMLQTFFRNPLVGPSVLGISSGASLGVAIVVLGAFYFSFDFSSTFGSVAIIISAIVGSFFILLLLLIFSRISNSNATLLIAGIMISYLIGASVQLLQQVADKSELQRFVYWGFGSFSGHSIKESYFYFAFILICSLPILFLVKSFNAWNLGPVYARSLGIQIAPFRLKVILFTGIITGIVTAYCGPIAFIGLAVPHLVKRIIQTGNHLVLFPAVMLAGASLCLVCDIIAKLPFWNSPLPLNAITSLFGAPIVIILLLKQRKYKSEE